jgi:S-DNA-T family DNA segregation ATPase FtsK/SpoIIIE
LDLGGGHLVVAGPARSGRSTAVAGYAAAAARAGRRTALVAPRLGAVHRRAANDGVIVLGPDEIAEVRAFEVVAVDDVERLTVDDPTVADLTGRAGPALIVGGLLDSFGFGARGLVLAVKKEMETVVLLSPPNHLAAEYVGVRIDRGAAFAGPPGRAFLLVDGTLMLGQVPDAAEG